MGFFGNLLGQGLGFLGSKIIPIPGVDGRTLGGAIGGQLLPFAKGGRVLATKAIPFKSGGMVKRGSMVKKKHKKKKHAKAPKK